MNLSWYSTVRLSIRIDLAKRLIYECYGPDVVCIPARMVRVQLRQAVQNESVWLQGSSSVSHNVNVPRARDQESWRWLCDNFYELTSSGHECTALRRYGTIVRARAKFVACQLATLNKSSELRACGCNSQKCVYSCLSSQVHGISIEHEQNLARNICSYIKNLNRDPQNGRIPLTVHHTIPSFERNGACVIGRLWARPMTSSAGHLHGPGVVG